MTRRAKLVPFILAVVIVAFGLWASGFISNTARGLRSRADSNSEGQCP